MNGADEAIRRALARLFPRREGAQYAFSPGDGEVRCAGLADRARGAAVTPRTTFNCFSTTKPITMVAVLQLVGRGLARLDDPIERYLPDLPYRNGATLRQLASHQAGLPNPLPLAWVHPAEDDARFDHAAFLRRVLREHPSAGAPGRRARYSNIGFLLLGRLVEVLSGQRYADYVRAHVLGAVPAAPDGYLDFALPPERHAAGYLRRLSALGLLVSLLPDAARLRVKEGAWTRYRPFLLDGTAYGGLVGNALGWLPLLQALARRDERLLPAPLYDELFAPQPLRSGAPSGHALAWFTGRVAGQDYLCHAGGGPGFGAEIRVYPARGAASVLLTNTTFISDTRMLDRLDAPWLG